MRFKFRFQTECKFRATCEKKKGAKVSKIMDKTRMKITINKISLKEMVPKQNRWMQQQRPNWLVNTSL
jgi:ribosomal protein S9